MSPQLKTWLRVLVDYGALVAFAAVFAFERLHLHDKDALIDATPTLMVGSVIAILVGYLLEKRVAPMPLLYGAFAIVFGGLALIFHDKSLLKMKPTFAYAAFAIALGAGLLLKRNPSDLTSRSAQADVQVRLGTLEQASSLSAQGAATAAQGLATLRELARPADAPPL